MVKNNVLGQKFIDLGKKCAFCNISALIFVEINKCL